jgi:hypothetical protein
LAGLIYQNFERLRKKFNQFIPWSQLYPWNPEFSVAYVDATRETWDEALHQLQFKILPWLKQQIKTLPQFLNPSELQNNMNGSILKSIIEIQSALDQSNNQMLSIAPVLIIPKPESSPNQADNQDLEEFKEFRRQGISVELKNLNLYLQLIFRLCYCTMKELEKPTEVMSYFYQD